MSAAKTLYALAVATGLALLVIWQSTLVRTTGYQLARLESAVRKATARKHKYKAQITKLKSPRRIFRLVKQLGIPLVAGSEPMQALSGFRADGESAETEPDGRQAPLSFPSTTAGSTLENTAGSQSGESSPSPERREGQPEQ